MNDCSMCNSSLSDTCHYICQNHMFDQISKGWVSTFHGLSGRRHHSLRSCLVLAGFTRSCLALSRGEMTFITRCPGGKKPKDKSHNLQEYNFTNIIQIHEAKNTTPEMEEKMRSATGKGRNETEPITARRAKPCPHLMFQKVSA